MRVFVPSLTFFILIVSCNTLTEEDNVNIRIPVDTIGFAQYAYQMDSIMSRIDDEDKIHTNEVNKAAICAHDDYTYAGGLYTKTLAGIKAKTVILIGVAHKAKKFNLHDKLVFGSFDSWKSVYGNIPVSKLRDKIISAMDEDSYVIHDSMIMVEHSLEAINPFLQKNNPSVEIIPVLVPYMKYADMQKISDSFAEVIYTLMENENLQYGKDLAIVISNDAVHYGDEDWGRDNMAPFGVDSIGNEKAREMDREIIDVCLIGEISENCMKRFTEYTVKEDDYKEYKWVWCGRYSVPFGLLTADKLNRHFFNKALNGSLIDYRTSNTHEHIHVKDIGLGTTAPANDRHWVGYAGIVYN